MARRLAVNKFKLRDAKGVVHGMAMPRDRGEAEIEAKRLGLEGEIIASEDYVEPEDTHSASVKKMADVYQEAATRSGIPAMLVELGPYVVLVDAHKGAQAFIEHAQAVKTTLSGLSVAEIGEYNPAKDDSWPKI